MKKLQTKVVPAKSVKPARKRVDKTPARQSPIDATAAVDAVQKAVKEKRIRGTFSLPASDYALIEELKSVSRKSGRVVKKNELFRAGLRALKAMNESAFQSALSLLGPAETKRRKKAK